MLCAKFVVQTENILKIMFVTVQQNINKGVLINVHKNQILKEWIH